MRIDGPDRLDISGSPPPEGKAPRPAKADDAAEASGGVTPTEKAYWESYIRQAMAGEEVDAKVVAEARKLLESGELDTPEAAEQAAKRVVSGGI